MIEAWIERAERLISIEQVLSRQLSRAEKQTLCWLATYQTSTVDNIQRIFDEVIELRRNGKIMVSSSKEERTTPTPETISYQKHHTGNFVVRYGKQEIIVLKDAFSKITGVSPEASLFPEAEIQGRRTTIARARTCCRLILAHKKMTTPPLNMWGRQ
ncbi:hypothetical protein [Paenibacillus tyrfis]|uniref:hypothetical protein n=1 Tax=Paenibacillus tyrfis TaxID=1501230 RepID=UPI0020A003E2|nr:hypothetical protein [Paenibacillus tyrfis]MCP1308998.1 hypothetical protein [Paenibacillus tyrfis]